MESGSLDSDILLKVKVTCSWGSLMINRMNDTAPSFVADTISLERDIHKRSVSSFGSYASAARFYSVLLRIRSLCPSSIAIDIVRACRGRCFHYTLPSIFLHLSICALDALTF